MLGVKIHKEPFGASCILSIRGKPSPACPLTSRLLTSKQGIRPAPLRIGPCRGGSGVERSGGLFCPPRHGPLPPPCPPAQPSSHERTPPWTSKTRHSALPANSTCPKCPKCPNCPDNP